MAGPVDFAELDFSNIENPEAWESEKQKIINGLYTADEIRRLRVEKECMPPHPGNPLHSPAQGLTDGLRPPLSPGTPGPIPPGGGGKG